jgi:hypothetical protein
MLSEWKNDLNIEAVCAENIVKTMVFVSFHFFAKSVILSILGSLLVVILGGFGDLWRSFCVF